jgi:hypothetical protein
VFEFKFVFEFICLVAFQKDKTFFPFSPSLFPFWPVFALSPNSKSLYPFPQLSPQSLATRLAQPASLSAARRLMSFRTPSTPRPSPSLHRTVAARLKFQTSAARSRASAARSR